MKKIIKIYNDYKKDFITYLTHFKTQLVLFFKNLKKQISNIKNRKKYLTLIGILIVINLILINKYISFSYYQDEDRLSILRSVVGDMYLNKYDYVLQIYLEDIDLNGSGNGNYYLTKEIPTFGYIYSGYKCKNDSTLVFDENTSTASVTTSGKESCSLYFDVIGNTDLAVKIMLEDDVNSNSYTISEKIPSYGYQYSHYDCTNNATLEYNSELHSIKVSSSTNEHCSVFFKKVSSDISLNLYVEENYQSEDYIERLSIPSNTVYSLNTNKSNCKNLENERVDTIITYVDGYINIETDKNLVCNIYLDRNE